MSYHFLEELFLATAESIRPAEKLTVSEAAHKYRYLKNPGQYIGYWDNDLAPYLTEIMDTTTSLDFEAVVFAGPARCGKSDIFFNLLAHTAICAPADMMLVHMTQSTARDWSLGDLRKVFRNSKEIGKRVLPGKQSMNVHDIHFTNGMRLLVKWPTITELSGKTLQTVWFMDYDRMDQNVDNEGSPFDLGRKRTQTLGRFAMTVAESSPGFEITNPKYTLSHPHEAPPTQGILSLFNTGDQRRFYWRCAHCGRPFEPSFKLLNWPNSEDIAEAAAMVTMDCPYPDCGYSHTHDAGPGQPGKREMNIGGKWIKRGQMWLPDGTVSGTALKSKVASFWLKGPAASFVSWSTIVERYLTAMRAYEQTGSTDTLKTTVNVDQGEPFMPPMETNALLPEDLKARAIDIGSKVVPAWVRFLIATIDVQKNAFVVQVHGISEGGDITIIDRFEIRKSDRVDEDGERYWVSPASYLEDWTQLVDKVIEKTYPLAEDPSRRMKIKTIACDSGGRHGVTAMAYNFWRWLRDEHPSNHHQRFQLVKGEPNPKAPRIRLSYPDSERKDRHAGGRGEVPIIELNSNMIKDQTYAMLSRTQEKGGRVNFPDWLEIKFYNELTAENRIEGKGWENKKQLRNEAWDLLCYCVAICLSYHVRIESIDWENPPSWADVLDKNDMVFYENAIDRPFEAVPQFNFDLSELGKKLV